MEKTFAELKNPGNVDRWNYTFALERFGTDAVDYLHQALSDEDKWVRYFAADSLGNLRDIKSVEHLIPLLFDPDQDVRTSVATALGKIGGTLATQALVHACSVDNCYVKIFIEEALDKLATENVQQVNPAAFSSA